MSVGNDFDELGEVAFEPGRLGVCVSGRSGLEGS